MSVVPPPVSTEERLEELRRDTPLGKLTYVGRPALLDEALALAAAAHSTSLHGAGRFVDLGGTRAYFKGSGFPGKARWRHALRLGLLRRPAPRLNELQNLVWLREHGFGAPEPLAAGVLRRGLWPVYQFLATAAIPGARGLRATLVAATPAQRATVLALLAEELARMHRLGFAHGDLFPRNVLVTGDEVPRLHFVDAWSRGPGRGAPAVQDLGALFVHAPSLLAAEEQRAFLARYLETRGLETEAAAGLARDVVSYRRRLLARERSRPDEGAVVEEWEW